MSPSACRSMGDTVAGSQRRSDTEHCHFHNESRASCIMHNHKKAITGYADTFNHGTYLGLTYLALLCNNRLYFLSHVGLALSLIKC